MSDHEFPRELRRMLETRYGVGVDELSGQQIEAGIIDMIGKPCDPVDSGFGFGSAMVDALNGVNAKIADLIAERDRLKAAIAKLKESHA